MTRTGGIDYAQNMFNCIPDSEIFLSQDSIIRTDKNVIKISTYQNVFDFFFQTLVFLFKGFFLIKNLKNKYKNQMVFYFPVFHPWNLILVFYSKFYKIKTVMTVHDFKNHLGEETFGMISIQKITMYMVHKIIFLTQSEAQKVKVKKLYKKIIIIPDPIFSIFDYNLDYKFNLNLSVLFFGRISVYKGISVLLKAFDEFKHLIFKLTIAGKLMGNNLKIPNNHQIQFLEGYLDFDEVKKLFLSHNILILPYIDASQSGILSIGIGCCIPMIISDLPGLREQLDDQCAYWVKLGSSADITKAIEWYSIKENYENVVQHLKEFKARQNQEIGKKLHHVLYDW
ncbi:MAG: glycosyltransferase [Saprospiraceae bacterium]|nr:glycosyltransferase [Saprospiraceae bacterium]